eukprot:GEMP01009662.1.p1 GENE.GEMP01009662.1~~GEMP01009662.1.p1  ORF type:complete len:487 (-),score=82.22 GEMP01009662.1:1943-3379(-)
MSNAGFLLQQYKLDPEPTQKYPVSNEDEPKKGQVGALDFFEGNATQLKKFEITEEMESITIGRSADCTIPLLLLKGESGISSKHVKIRYNKDGYKDKEKESTSFTITDISSNGIRHNGLQPEKNVALPLHHKDIVKMGYNPEVSFAFLDAAAVPKGIHLLYDLRTKIGSGNFSEVKLAISRKNGKKYAIKILDRKRFEAFSRKRNTHLDFATEVETLTKLKHPCIVRYFEYKEEGDLKYVVTEFLEGGDLLQRLLDIGKYTENGTKRIFFQLLTGLKYLHDMRVVHRDLKPENVLLSDKSDNAMAKIADFGLARILPQASNGTALFKTFCGTPHYFAPELIQSQQGQCKGYGKEVDLWSAGVILYILLSTTPPFEDENLYQQIVKGEYDFDVPDWATVPQCAKELVRHLMQVNPTKRYTVSQALEHEYLGSVSVTRISHKRARSPNSEAAASASIEKSPFSVTASADGSSSVKDVEMT